MNVSIYNEKGKSHTNSHGHNYGHGRGHTHGRRRGRGGHFKKNYTHYKWNNKDGKGIKDQSKKGKSVCHRCGSSDHWSRTCRTPKHLVDLYQQSIKGKGKNVETNFFYVNDKDDYGITGSSQGYYGLTDINVDEFLISPDRNV